MIAWLVASLGRILVAIVALVVVARLARHVGDLSHAWLWRSPGARASARAKRRLAKLEERESRRRGFFRVDR